MPAGLETIIEQGPLSAMRAVVEILILSYFFYRFLVVVRGTRAEPVLLGVAVIGVFYLLTGVLGLEGLNGMMSAAGPYVFVVLIIIFQPEIRNLLRQITLQVLPSRRLSGLRRDVYEDVIFAVAQLAQTRTGALIVLERETGLRTFIQSGVALDARLSSDLLVSLFQRRSLLHDGAAIIRRERILAAACFLPLTTNPGLVATLGSRHRAAIGVTEESDCVTIVVSEINGRISLAVSGRIELDVSLDHIREKLNVYFGRVVAARPLEPSAAPAEADPTPQPQLPETDAPSPSESSS